MGPTYQWRTDSGCRGRRFRGSTHDRQNMRYQQNLKGRKIAFVVIGNQQWPTLRRYTELVVAAVNAATPGSFAKVDIPSQ
jgi:hypothetical protein